MAHSKEIEAFKEALEREKSRVLALEAVQTSMQTAHRDIVSRLQDTFDQEMEALKNNVDSAHGEQVQELQSLLEERHKRVSRDTSAGQLLLVGDCPKKDVFRAVRVKSAVLRCCARFAGVMWGLVRRYRAMCVYIALGRRAANNSHSSDNCRSKFAHV